MPVAEIDEDTGGVSVDGLPADDDEGTGHGTQRAHGARDAQHTRGDLDLEQDDDEALPGDGAEVDAVAGGLEDFLVLEGRVGVVVEAAVVGANDTIADAGLDVDGADSMLAVVALFGGHNDVRRSNRQEEKCEGW